jgi:tetratricopeptide (TPR) repeat protein
MRNVFIAAVLLLAPLLVSGSSKNYIQWWVENHGDYAKTEGKHDQRVGWTSEVFERVKRTADKTGGREPRLLIIRTRYGIYARSLPDGGVIINPATLDICYGGEQPSRREGDLRMAFILGHELAHLGSDDFIHGEVSDILDKYGSKNARKEIPRYFNFSDREKSDASKRRELLADKRGVIYAAMAGYDVGELFRGPAHFLKYWASQTGIGILYDRTPTHPSLAKRLEFIQPQLQQVAGRVELFNAGVLLFQLESYHDAASAFKEFSKSYPSREVFNNMGACYFYLAMRRILKDYRDDYYHFRFSTAIDYATTAMRFQARGDKNYLADKDIARYIDNAVDYFQRAVKRDPPHKTTLCNLSAAFLLKREYAMVLATCDKILESHPHDAHALNNKAIALYYYGKKEDVDMTQRAVRQLQKAHELEPGNLEVLYNLAAVKERRNRMAGAKEYWKRYLAGYSRIPGAAHDNFFNHVYKKLNSKEPLVHQMKGAVPAVPRGIRLGRAISSLERQWGKTGIKSFTLGGEDDSGQESLLLDLRVMVKGDVRVLALDGSIEVVELEFRRPKNTAESIKILGPPLRVVRHTAGHFYVYKGFSFKEINGKVVSYTWFSPGF